MWREAAISSALYEADARSRALYGDLSEGFHQYKEVVAEYVTRARSSLELDDISPEGAAQLVAEGRRKR